MIDKRFLTLLLLLVVACTVPAQEPAQVPTEPTSEPETFTEVEETSNPQVETPPEPTTHEPQGEEPKELNWRDIELKDINTQKTYKISELKQPILIESFAVWCPTCLEQQKIMKNVKATHVSLDTDPNEDEARVQEHLDRHKFDWYFSISPPEVTKQLIKEFGIKVVSAPSAPLILLCNNEAFFFRSGLKQASEINKEINTRCQ